MTFTEQIITIAIVVLGTMATRFLPFVIFNSKTKTPAYVQYLGKVLPSATMSLLVVFSLRHVDVSGISWYAGHNRSSCDSITTPMERKYVPIHWGWNNSVYGTDSTSIYIVLYGSILNMI